MTEWAAGYWVAWRQLGKDRPIGAMGGAGYIPWSSIERYADRRGYDDDILSRLLWAMDDVYLAWLNDEQQKKQADKKPDAS